jgi:alkylation response protein AidB-like acyl-CoA dehydrogenase
MYRPPVRETVTLLRHVIGLDRILGYANFGHVDAAAAEQAIEAAGKFCAEVIAPLDGPSDRIGARLENGRVRSAPGFPAAYRPWCEGGWPGLALPEDVGGQNLPEIVQGALSEFVNGANVSFGMLTTTGRAAARVLQAHAEPAERAIYLPKLASGEWAATITMTEPQAGSDIGMARMKAAPLGGSRYAISGTKIFISWGDHDLAENVVNIVLARIEGAPAGVKGLSLFLVPSRKVDSEGKVGAWNGVRAQRLENKMGIHGSPTCEMRYENAEGILLGAPGSGVRNMFTMINTMRLEVCFEGMAMMAKATDRALAYALERPQGQGAAPGAPARIVEHPDVQRMLLVMKALADSGRAFCMECAALLDASRWAPGEAERRDAAELLAWMLPIGKSAMSYQGVEVAQLGVQIGGGHGYVHETGFEQIARDARIMPIYEGTNGIQAIDLVTRKLPANGGRGYRLFVDRIAADLKTLPRAAETAAIRGMVSEELGRLESITPTILGRLAAAPADTLAGAHDYLTLCARLAQGWMLLRMASAGAAPADWLAEKRVLARFYAEHLMIDAPVLAQRALAGYAPLAGADFARMAAG